MIAPPSADEPDEDGLELPPLSGADAGDEDDAEGVPGDDLGVELDAGQLPEDGGDGTETADVAALDAARLIDVEERAGAETADAEAAGPEHELESATLISAIHDAPEPPEAEPTELSVDSLVDVVAPDDGEVLDNEDAEGFDGQDSASLEESLPELLVPGAGGADDEVDLGNMSVFVGGDERLDDQQERWRAVRHRASDTITALPRPESRLLLVKREGTELVEAGGAARELERHGLTLAAVTLGPALVRLEPTRLVSGEPEREARTEAPLPGALRRASRLSLAALDDPPTLLALADEALLAGPHVAGLERVPGRTLAVHGARARLLVLRAGSGEPELLRADGDVARLLVVGRPPAEAAQGEPVLSASDELIAIGNELGLWLGEADANGWSAQPGCAGTVCVDVLGDRFAALVRRANVLQVVVGGFGTEPVLVHEASVDDPDGAAGGRALRWFGPNQLVLVDGGGWTLLQHIDG